jgi:hypothetical protein
MGPIGCHETSVSKYQSTSDYIPQEKRPLLCFCCCQLEQNIQNIIMSVIVTHKWIALKFQFVLHANGWLTWPLQIMTTARTEDHKSNELHKTQPCSYRPTRTHISVILHMEPTIL